MRSFNNTQKKILFYAKVQHYLLHFITLGFFFLPLFSVLYYSQRTSSAFTGNISFKETATDEQMLNTDTPGLRKIPSQGVVFHRRCLNSICFSPLAASQPASQAAHCTRCKLQLTEHNWGKWDTFERWPKSFHWHNNTIAVFCLNCCLSDILI